MRPILGVADCERNRHETGWCEMPATIQLAATCLLNVNDARCIALFAFRAAAIERADRRSVGPGHQPRHPTARCARLRRPDGPGVRRPPRRCRDAHVLGAPAGTGGDMNETCDRCGPAVRAARTGLAPAGADARQRISDPAAPRSLGARQRIQEHRRGPVPARPRAQPAGARRRQRRPGTAPGPVHLRRGWRRLHGYRMAGQGQLVTRAALRRYPRIRPDELR